MPIPAEIYLDNPPVRSSRFAARCVEWFQAAHRRRRWRREMAKAAAFGGLDEILADLGMTRGELDELMSEPANIGLQFEKMARMLGTDCARLSPGAVHDAMQVCARCECRTACKRWLQTGVWRYDGDPRCPNAALLRS
jgi:hypothetical protein